MKVKINNHRRKMVFPFTLNYKGNKFDGTVTYEEGYGLIDGTESEEVEFNEPLEPFIVVGDFPEETSEEYEKILDEIINTVQKYRAHKGV